eukprot:2243035-Pleurochrysis_carterae.AAC.2
MSGQPAESSAKKLISGSMAQIFRANRLSSYSGENRRFAESGGSGRLRRCPPRWRPPRWRLTALASHRRAAPQIVTLLCSKKDLEAQGNTWTDLVFDLVVISVQFSY